MSQEPLHKETDYRSFGFIFVQSFTIARIPVAILFGLLLVYAPDTLLKLLACLALLGFIEISDAADGHIARHYNLVSEYGAMLDPYADSISRLIIYFSLASNDLVLFLVPLCMALRDVTVAYSRIVLAKKNRTVSAKRSGKIKAAFQALGAFAALFGPYYWDIIGSWSFYALSWVIMLVTLVSAVEYVHSAIHALKEN
jgi:CDP-diacylglycerol--glycerol-3-phosphate 3-phosphatidyltransferase